MSTGSEILLERVRAATADEYTIEGEIGRGGMAAVFRARDIALQRRVAIKVMLPDLIDVEGNQDRFVIEARTAAHLDHPGIVAVYSVKQRAGLLFIVMKYLEGRTLEEVMRGSRAQNPAIVTAIVRQVAEALQFAHSAGVVHRDVKPGNVIVDARGRPVVTDFGIAKVASSRSITVAGSMLGTPTYMSPEQCRGLPATPASDQYALGVMTYEMLAGRAPFTGSMFELVHKHVSEPPQPLRELVPAIDPALEETVMRMLAKNPSDRWGSLGEVVQRLGGSLRHQPPPPELGEAIAEFAGGDKTVAFDPAAATVNIVSAPREAVTTPVALASLTVMPHEPTVDVGQSLQLHVSESSGATVAGGRVAWRSEDPTIAAVDENGVVTGIRAGYANITVMAGGEVGRVGVTVNAQATVIVAADALAPSPSRTKSRGMVFAGIAIAVVMTALWLRPWSTQGGPVGQSAQPAVTRPRPVPDTVPATTRDAKGSPVTVPVPAAQPPAKVASPPKPDSARLAAARQDSARAECPKLLERISLGETLTAAETARFKRLCTK